VKGIQVPVVAGQQQLFVAPVPMYAYAGG